MYHWRGPIARFNPENPQYALDETGVPARAYGLDPAHAPEAPLQ
eukprot:gene8855-11366_t